MGLSRETIACRIIGMLAIIAVVAVTIYYYNDFIQTNDLNTSTVNSPDDQAYQPDYDELKHHLFRVCGGFAGVSAITTGALVCGKSKGWATIALSWIACILFIAILGGTSGCASNARNFTYHFVNTFFALSCTGLGALALIYFVGAIFERDPEEKTIPSHGGAPEERAHTQARGKQDRQDADSSSSSAPTVLKEDDTRDDSYYAQRDSMYTCNRFPDEGYDSSTGSGRLCASTGSSSDSSSRLTKKIRHNQKRKRTNKRHSRTGGRSRRKRTRRHPRRKTKKRGNERSRKLRKTRRNLCSAA